MFLRIATFTMAMTISLACAAAEHNPFVGTWILAPEQSTFNYDIRRVSHVLTLREDGDGLRSNSKIVYEDGRELVTSWQAEFDETPATLNGDTHYNNVKLKRIDARSLEITSMREGTMAARTSRWVISPHGRTMTKIQTVMDA